MAKKKAPKKGVSLAEFAAITTYSDLMSLLLTMFVLLFALSEPKRPKLQATLAAMAQRLNRQPPAPPPKPATRPQRLSPPEMGVLRRGPPGKRTEVATLTENERQKIVIGGDGLFRPGSAALSPEARRVIQYDVAPDLKGFHNRIEIIGHAARGDDGPPEEVWVLADRRAQAVMRFLVDGCGVEEDRFRLVNCGDKEPRDPANPALNRRVEVIMTEFLINSGLGE